MLTLLIFQTVSADLRFSCKYFRLHRICQVNTTAFQFNSRLGNLRMCISPDEFRPFAPIKCAFGKSHYKRARTSKNLINYF